MRILVFLKEMRPTPHPTHNFCGADKTVKGGTSRKQYCFEARNSVLEEGEGKKENHPTVIPYPRI